MLYLHESGVLVNVCFGGWPAPQQMDLLLPSTGRPNTVGKLLSPTNVYAVGLNILTTMNRDL